ncbi:hypothetical protein SAMN05216289_1374 [Dokdonella immobilis]|uniref:Uncharacterized protein n=1 Tax=Dokdonella immobilis TaxID=578942 RepID=A0A1I5AFA1_9GAMM|nr:hypothetical protein SAMN05216289_1374 [Dokdonella immobilis]
MDGPSTWRNAGRYESGEVKAALIGTSGMPSGSCVTGRPIASGYLVGPWCP